MGLVESEWEWWRVSGTGTESEWDWWRESGTGGE